MSLSCREIIKRHVYTLTHAQCLSLSQYVCIYPLSIYTFLCLCVWVRVHMYVCVCVYLYVHTEYNKYASIQLKWQLTCTNSPLPVMSWGQKPEHNHGMKRSSCHSVEGERDACQEVTLYCPCISFLVFKGVLTHPAISLAMCPTKWENTPRETNYRWINER